MQETKGNDVLKTIILGSGRSEITGVNTDNIPACLLGDTFGSRVLDWILAAFANVNVHNIVFVGGYRINDIAEKYRKLKYILNHDWESTGVLESLNKAKSELNSPLFVSYADIVFTPLTCRRMLAEGGDGISIAVDTSWRKRGSIQEGAIRKNMVVLDGDYVRDIGFLPVSMNLNAEFIGLAYFGPASLSVINSFFDECYPRYAGKPFEQSSDVRKSYLTDLFRYLIKSGVQVKALDIGTEWAEMDSLRDLCRFVIGTKAQTLDRLSNVIKKGKFCRQFTFTVRNWQVSREQILDEIQKLFSPKLIVVRSSSLVEDSWVSSLAGQFKSITGIESTSRNETLRGIDSVIDSYQRNDLAVDSENQVLVQEMVCDVVMSGVVFTRDLESGAPYYVINYDDQTSRTDAVTSGCFDKLKTVLVHRSSEKKAQDPRIADLLNVVREIEIASGSSALDIEFAINSADEVFILQTRPMTCVSADELLTPSKEDAELIIVRNFLKHRFRPVTGLFGKSTIFGDMPDWNPAEMIGCSPKPLAASLYHYLITNSAWRIARGRIGYFNPEPATLMSVIGGHPYIDVRSSFNSFLPRALAPELSEKLVNYYLRRLETHPELHDKIEFEVLLTCLDFNFDNESKRFTAAGFTGEELFELRQGLFTLTDDIVCGRVEPLPSLINEMALLATLRYDLLNKYGGASEIPLIIGHLLDDCIKYGTVPFSILARYAFIANSFLNSLVARDIFSLEDKQSFLHSIETVATELVRDMYSDDISRSGFLFKYGHLRPGTYDITSYRYDEKPEFYFPTHAKGKQCQEGESKLFKLSSQKQNAIEKLITETGFSFSVEQLFDFMRDSIRYRESGKFEFTKTVSEILMLLERFGKEYAFSREDLSYLNVEQVRLWGVNAYACDYPELLATEIENGKRWFHRSRGIRLPHLITCLDDIELINLSSSRPNFVTLKKVTGSIQKIDNNTAPSSVCGKIVLVEGADPGFDWIFAHGITGLITKYGGAASHMTIRAAEFGIPAAIGCGELLFNKLLSAVTITLDSGAQTIHVT